MKLSLFFGCLLFCFVFAKAQTVTVDSIVYQIGSDAKSASVFRVDTLIKEAIIHKTIRYKNKSYKVKAIKPLAFSNCAVMTKVTIPEGVESMDGDTFADCSDLKHLFLPSTMTAINCTPLFSPPDFKIDTHNTVYSIRDGVLFDKEQKNLLQYPYNRKDTCYVIPEGVTKIAACAFLCSPLKQISFPSSLQFIDHSAFEFSFLKTVHLENTHVKEIKSSTFFYSTALVTVFLPTKLTKIGPAAFRHCSSLKTINLQDTKLSDINCFAFMECEQLTTVIFPKQLTSINSFAFEGCRSLQKIKFLGNQISLIGQKTFDGCHLKSIQFPFTFKSLFRKNQFKQCILSGMPNFITEPF